MKETPSTAYERCIETTYLVCGYSGAVSEHDNLKQAREAASYERTQYGEGFILKEVKETTTLTHTSFVQNGKIAPQGEADGVGMTCK